MRIHALDQLSLRVALASLLPLVLLAASASAQTQPYSFEVDSFSVPERGIFDDFDDGSLSPAWDGTVFGSAVESGTTLRLSSPGVFGFLPAPIVTENSVVSGHGIQVDLGGNFTATSRWLQNVPSLSQGMNMAFGSVDSTTGNVHQLSIGLSNTTSEVAGVLGGGSGLGLSVLNVVRDRGPGNVLSLTRTDFAIDASAVTGAILLQLVFDDAANTLTPRVSLDGGATTLSPFEAVPWNYFGGGFALSASSTVVPEPGTALLLGLGLIGLGARRAM